MSSQREMNKIDRAFGLKLNITRMNQVILVCWKPSSSYILSTYGSYFSYPGAAGCAYVLRDQHGHFILVVSVFLGHVDSFTAEIMKIFMEMRKCASIGLWNVRVQMDNKPLAQMLDKGEEFPWRNYAELCEIYKIMDTYTYEVEHIFREVNVVANFLAKQASSGLSIKYNCASMLPHTTRSSLRLDSIFYPYLREKGAIAPRRPSKTEDNAVKMLELDFCVRE